MSLLTYWASCYINMQKFNTTSLTVSRLTVLNPSFCFVSHHHIMVHLWMCSVTFDLTFVSAPERPLLFVITLIRRVNVVLQIQHRLLRGFRNSIILLNPFIQLDFSVQFHKLWNYGFLIYQLIYHNKCKVILCDNIKF